MNAKQLSAFKAVMLSGSMSDASRMLYVSQPAVSRLIKDLEDSLDFQLFERRNSRLYPTQAAQSFYREVQRHFIGMDNLAQAADQIRMMRRGRLRIAAMPAIASSIMPSVLSQFLNSREDVSANFAPHLSVELANRVGAQKFDLGMVMLPIDNKEISFGPCYQASCVCIAPAGHRFEQQDVVVPSDLHREPFVAIGLENTVLRFLIDDALRKSRTKPDERIETMLLPTAAQLVQQGLGVSIIDPFTAHTFAAHTFSSHPCGTNASTNRDVVIRPFEPDIPFYFGFIVPANHTISGLTQEFVECFEHYASEHFCLTPVDPNDIAVV